MEPGLDRPVEEIFADEEESPKTPSLSVNDYIDKVRFVGLAVIENYGWLILFAIIIAVFIWRKYGRTLSSSIDSATSNEILMKKYDNNVLYQRQEAMLAARLKMQEKQNQLSEEFMKQAKEKEEEKRQKKIEEWEAFEEGKGYRNKQHFEENQPVTKIPKSSKKPSIKPDNYNPLMGSGGGGGYRPSRRGCGPSSGG